MVGAFGRRNLSAMLTDLVLEPAGASVDEILAAARIADAGGWSGIWVYDHITAMAWTGSWSRDPFAILGAIATVTGRVTIGPLVANVYHRHPAQLALAMNTLQALSGNRAICGVGAGASPGSRFAVDYDALGIELDDADGRRRRLVESIDLVRTPPADDRFDLVDDSPAPKVIVGASSEATIRIAAEHADGVNIRVSEHLESLAKFARTTAACDAFEVSAFTSLDADHDLGGDPDRLAAAGAERRTLAVRPPYPLAALERISSRLADHG